MKTPSRPFRHSRIVSSLLVLAVLLFHAGCVAVVAGGAGAGAVAYIRGEVKGNVSATVERTATAVDRVLSDMELHRIQAESDTVSGEFVARTSDDRRVRVRLARAGTDVTEVRVRVGTFGDETLSRDIFNRIEARL